MYFFFNIPFVYSKAFVEENHFGDNVLKSFQSENSNQGSPFDALVDGAC